MTRPRVVHAFSAGGVVYRSSHTTPGAATPDEQPFEVVLVGHPDEGVWVLPKGTPVAGETAEQTAVREVREETGVAPRIVGDLGSIQYWFSRRGVRYHKEVRHYLMAAVGGDVAQHDHEYAEARWFRMEEAIARLTHENEAEVVRRAVVALREHIDRSTGDPTQDPT